jgi:hypothetical protein
MDASRELERMKTGLAPMTQAEASAEISNPSILGGVTIPIPVGPARSVAAEGIVPRVPGEPPIPSVEPTKLIQIVKTLAGGCSDETLREAVPEQYAGDDFDVILEWARWHVGQLPDLGFRKTDYYGKLLGRLQPKVKQGRRPQ